MKTKVCVVTGANAGLGYETTKAFAKQQAEVIMICRSRERGEAARRSIISDTGNSRVHLIQADLASQSEVRAAGREINDRWMQVDILVNNAAAVVSDHTLTEDGIETQFAVNHLAYFLLTSCLMPSFRKSEEARIVNISSGNHTKGRIYFDNLNLAEEYQVLKAYNQTKLANVLFTYELDRRLRQRNIGNVSVHCVDPGLNNTGIGVKSTNFLHALVWTIRRAMGMPPAEGAKCQIFVATDPELKGMSGKYWYRSKAVSSSRSSYDTERAERLWSVSAELCGLKNFFENQSRGNELDKN